ncbi:hypothetical protein F8M41_007646 [Gigaspora margarita]|uniref:Uncharacterized protein n=1 Tax=Gigaspora margarita TaxID=4874 RepID=A0A8H3X5E1_GIGMA|nr:hypothetical protein F8M41_007646 [Gigaspora margarita]
MARKTSRTQHMLIYLAYSKCYTYCPMVVTNIVSGLEPYQSKYKLGYLSQLENFQCLPTTQETNLLLLEEFYYPGHSTQVQSKKLLVLHMPKISEHKQMQLPPSNVQQQ